MNSNYEIMNAVYEYKLAKALCVRTFKQFGVCSQEYYDAMTVVIATESVIIRNGLEVEAGLKYANVWD